MMKQVDIEFETHRNNSVPPVNFVRLPGPVDHVEHAGLGRLGGGVEPGGGGQVEPGVGHKVGVVEQQPTLPEHGLAELTVVEIVTQLLRSSSVIFLEVPLPEKRTHCESH